MENYDLFKNMKVENYIFKDDEKSLFSSSSINEEIRITANTLSHVVNTSNGTMLLSENSDKTIYKIFHGVCDEKMLSNPQIYCNSIIEVPKENYLQKRMKHPIATYEEINKIESYSTEFKIFDYKKSFRDLEKVLKREGAGLKEIVGYGQELRFIFMEKNLYKGVGFRHFSNILVSYEIQGKQESKSLILCKLDIELGIKQLEYFILESIFPYKYKNKRTYFISESKEVIVQGKILVELIRLFYFTYYTKHKGILDVHVIPKISNSINIMINAPENLTVGGTIDGIGNALFPQFLCKNGETLDCDSILRKYDYREKPSFKIDKAQILPGIIDIDRKKEGHILEIVEMQGIQESYNPQSMEFIAFMKVQEVKEKRVIEVKTLTRKIRLQDILCNIIGLGQVCKYEEDGSILSPDAILEMSFLNNE